MSMLIPIAFLAVGLVLSFVLFPVGLIIGVPLVFWALNKMGINVKR